MLQRLPWITHAALLRLSWGSLDQSLCLANLSFTEAKPIVRNMEDFDYKMAEELSA